MINNKAKNLEYLIPLLLGFVFFVFIFGTKPLNVFDISWIGGTDAMQNYLGWQFFRQSPWSFPIIGSSPNFGMEIGSSIVYSDSNPLLAVIFKIASPILPKDFQYFGVWLLLCCAFQSLLIWKIISKFTNNIIIKFLSTTLLMFNPAWINRVGHINLVAHFLILAAIYLVISGLDKAQKTKWLALILVSFSIHFYIALIVSAIWGCGILSRIILRKQKVFDIFLEFTIIIAASIGLMYILGYFTVTDVSKSGQYGTFGNNTLSPIMPSGWSYLMSGLSLPASGFESFNFWGVGAILMALLAGIVWLKKPQLPFGKDKTITFLLACVFFSILYTTNVIGVGTFSYRIDLPYQVLDALSIVRASGRFFWPVTYIILITSITILSSNVKPKYLYMILSFCAFIQIIDTSKGYNSNSFYFFKRQITDSELTNKFWSEDLKRYDAIRYVPFQNHISPWYELSKVAENAKIRTDAVYLARFSGKIVNNLNYKVVSELVFGDYKNNEVYVIRDDLVDYVSLKGGDSIYKIDGLNVLAHGFNGCDGCSPVKQMPDRNIYIFKSNWLEKQVFGQWNDGERTLILIKNSEPNNKLNISYNLFTPEQAKQQRLIFKVNGVLLKELVADGNGEINLNWTNKNNSNISTLTIETPDAIEPRKVGLNTDSRLISLSIQSINFE
ncbi:DUF6311 domain-containing protein [Pantoea sp. GbtcB22]|uniref:DUF6311 domain-containing protein n=1 Tax=Pantoea sp. GbtcB22 TaxID=2824767 RepID=UPI001C30D537